MSSKIIDGLKLIQQYNKQLQVQNIAKNYEIEALKKEMDLIGLSQKIQALNNLPVCQECVRKQQEIETLIKAIKSLRRTPSKSRATLINEVSSNQQINSEIDKSISQSYLRKPQVVGDKTPLFLSREQLDIMTKYNHRSKTVFSVPSDQARELQIIKQQVASRSQQNQILKKRLQFFEKKVIQLEEVNKILRQQVVKIKAQQSSLSYGLRQYSNNPYPKPKQAHMEKTSQRTPIFTAIRSQVVKTVKLVPEFIPIAQPIAQPKIQKSNRNQIPKSQRNRLIQTTKCSCSKYESPLEVSICDNKCNSRRYKSIDQNLLEQRKRNLKHKIKVLEGQNKKLRTEIFESNY